MRHFEPQGKVPATTELEKEFLIRETQSCLLTKGRTSSLSRTRDNIHWFQAGENGAAFLDFGIKFKGPGDGPKAGSSLTFDADAVDSAKCIHRAKWLGDD